MKRLFTTLFVLLIALGVAGHFAGHLGRLLGSVRVWVQPEDSESLAFFEPGTRFVGVAQLPLLSWPDSFAGDETLRDKAKDLEDVTGVRPFLDIDTVVVNEKIQVLRGRFAWSKMSVNLASHGYQITNHGGRPLAVQKSGGDTLMLSGPYLIHGDFAAVTEAVDRAVARGGLKDTDRLTKALNAQGWRHGVFGAALLSEGKVSVGDILNGQGDLRSFSFNLETLPDIWRLAVVLDTSTLGMAKELVKRLNEGRTWLVERLEKSSDPLANAWSRVLVETTIEQLEGSHVQVRFAVPLELVDKAMRQHEQSTEPLRQAMNSDQEMMRRLLQPLTASGS